MIEILPIKLLTDEDSPIFGRLNIYLGKLKRTGLAVSEGIAVTAPDLKLKTTLENIDKEIHAIPSPAVLIKEVNKHKQFLFNGLLIKSVKNLWLSLLDSWLLQIKDRLWKNGFYPGITEDLEVQIVVFAVNPKAWGSAYWDFNLDDTVINIKTGSLSPNDLKNLDGLVKEANKKLYIPHEYQWVLDRGIKLTGVSPFTPVTLPFHSLNVQSRAPAFRTEAEVQSKSAVKVFLDLSSGLVVERAVDGIYIASEKIFDLNKPNDSFEELVFKLVESAVAFPNSLVFCKLADKSEGMGKVRGTLRLLHQKSLLDPLLDALDFVRHKKGLVNVHIVVPFVRGAEEFLQIKRELAVKKLSRKNSLQLWMEIAVPENILNLENYLMQGLDGVVLNLDELVSYLGGFDSSQQELASYKNQLSGLLKFLDDGLKLLHKSKTPFLAYGSLSLYPEVLDFLVEKGVYGIVVERYETQFSQDLLRQSEKRLILGNIK